MANSFFDRLFAGKVLWAMHTAMTCDLAYVSALIEKQQGDQIKYTLPDCAFFFDANKGAPTCRINSPSFSVKELSNYVFSLTPKEQTHHAKISLVCYMKDKAKDNKKCFRLAVYSRNLEFSSSIDTALLFELEESNEKTKSGKQLCSYLKKLHEIADSNGKAWLNNHIFIDKDVYLNFKNKNITLVSEFGTTKRTAELYFGGCGTNLGTLLALDKVTDNSIVLTPPEFIRGTSAQDFFTKTKPILYDHEEKPSHVKLYLLAKPKEKPEKYELWVGSANATPRGIGWNFANHSSTNYSSIECLVKFKLRNDIFDTIKGQITNYGYVPYANFSDAGSLQVTPDLIGSYIVKNYICESVEYDYDSSKITITLKKVSGSMPVPNCLDKFEWRPLEYSKSVKVNFCRICPGSRKELTLEYPFEKFRPSQGILVFGESCCMMEIPNDLLKGIPMQKTTIVKDTRLTEWLLDPCAQRNVSDKTPEGLKWYKDVLDGKEPDSPNTDSSLSAVQTQQNNSTACGYLPPLSESEKSSKPMRFQQKGAERLYRILFGGKTYYIKKKSKLSRIKSKKIRKINKHLQISVNSRAFLADEPGLGKTFTSAMLIYKMAEAHFKKNSNAPFYVIYVAPNLTLIEQNVRELVEKYNATKGKYHSDIEALPITALATPKEKLKWAYEAYYNILINECDNKIQTYKTEIVQLLNCKKNSQITFEMLEYNIAKNILSYISKHNPTYKVKITEILHYIQTFLSNPNNKNTSSIFKNSYNNKLTTIKPDVFKRIYNIAYLGILKNSENRRKSDLQYSLGTICKYIDESNFKLDNRRSTIKKLVTEIRRNSTLQQVIEIPDWDKLREYYENVAAPDRLAFAHNIIQKSNTSKKKRIIFIGVSSEVALGDESRSESENSIFKKYKKDGKTIEKRSVFTECFLQYYKSSLIIWDEFHRYFTKFKNSYFNNPFFAHEQKSDMKSLFVSATPYKTNISGAENKAVLEDLYRCSVDDESPDVALPSFDDFTKLFCGGKTTFGLNSKSLQTAYNNRANNKLPFESLLKLRMIRNERTRLQNYYEEHISCFVRTEQYDGVHARILLNTARQSRLLKKAGYEEGARKWSFSLPWILCFSTDRTSARKGVKDKNTYYDLLQPKKVLSKRLFVYNKKGKPIKKRLLTLPHQNLAMYQICEKNLMCRHAAQLLWVPATMPLYKPGGNSIFSRLAGYSKLLVFAEYRYLQRGGARLLSDYARMLCNSPVPMNGFKPEIKSCELDIRCFALTIKDYREMTLDELLDAMPPLFDYKDKLYQLASPAACAVRLGLDQGRITQAFNCYFNSAGVKEALWSWLCDNGYSDEEKWEEGILRYCAEGNLYSVMEEWLFCMKERNPDDRTAYIENILNRVPSKVGVQTLDSTKNQSDGKAGFCGFAEQLTGDVTDVGTGENEKATKQISNAFNSPLYPMILFAGRGAQEGIDMHNYCLRIMHLTLPRGAVSYEQRNGRIDRYRSLLVRRRAAERTQNMCINNSGKDLLARTFEYLENNNPPKDNKLYPNWSIPNDQSIWHFEELMPVWEYTEESCFVVTMNEMLRNYRESMGILKKDDNDNNEHIDLSTM